MSRYTLEQRWEILKAYFQSDCCVAQTVRVLKRNFGRNEAPTAPAVRNFVEKVRTTGYLIDNRGPRRCTVLTDENVAAVAETVRLNPGTSTRRLSQQLKISRTSLRRILLKDLESRKSCAEAAASDDVELNGDNTTNAAMVPQKPPKKRAKFEEKPDADDAVSVEKEDATKLSLDIAVSERWQESKAKVATAAAAAGRSQPERKTNEEPNDETLKDNSAVAKKLGGCDKKTAPSANGHRSD